MGHKVLLLTGFWGDRSHMFAQFSSFLMRKFPSLLSSLCCPCLLIHSFSWPSLYRSVPLLARPLAKWDRHTVGSPIPLVCFLPSGFILGLFIFSFSCLPQPSVWSLSVWPLSPVLSFLPWVSLLLSLSPFFSFNPSLNLHPHPLSLYFLLFTFLVVSTSVFSVSLCLNAS